MMGFCRYRMAQDLVDRLEVVLRRSKALWSILQRCDEIGLPDCWLVAGCVAQTVWNAAFRQDTGTGIKDADIVYFEAPDLSARTESRHERRLRGMFGDLPLKLDVKNEARVHLWYEDRFGYPITPYSSCTDAIASFPTTATAVGVRLNDSRFECCAPFGLDDLFGLIVRPNKRQITRAIYDAKVQRWRSVWPQLTYLPWEEIGQPMRSRSAGR
jgi:uncharacterized protein